MTPFATVRTIPTCPACGQPLPSDAPRGLCPACLLGLLAGVEEPDLDAEVPGTAGSGLACRPAAAPEGQNPATVGAARRRFGDYELIEEIGRGGMGVVFKARQAGLGRVVALKLILAGRFASPESVRRFRSEASAAAALQHPNIVAVHEVGACEGQHFFSMDYVEGQNLAQRVGPRPLSAVESARYVKLMAGAIHYAHEHGILHRDLKPANVLIDADDQPRITDFGLAKRLGSEGSLTSAGQALGSPGFMPPEQMSSNAGPVGRPSDVYALGSILYYLLTARPPFQGETIEVVVHHVLHADPVSPRLLNPSVPRDLETICAKCLEKSPDRRYATAQALADDLGRFLEGQPVRARPLGPVGRIWRWCRRRPALTTVLLLLHLVLALGLGGILWQWRRATHGERAARQGLYAADIGLAKVAFEAGNLGRAVELLERNHPSAPAVRKATGSADRDLRGWEWHYLWRQCRSRELATLGRHGNSVTALAFSPDGRRLVTGCALGELRLWDVTGRRLLATSQVAGRINALSFSCDGQVLASAGETSGARLWDAITLAPRAGLGTNFPEVLAVRFLPGDGTLLTADSHGIAWWNLPDLDPLDRSPVDSQWNAAFSADGEWFAAGRGKGALVVHRLKQHRPVPGQDPPLEGPDHGLPREALQVPSAVAAPDGRESGDGARTLEGHTRPVLAVAFSPNGRWLASGSADTTTRVRELPSGKEIACLDTHRSTVSALAFSPDGRRLATASYDQTIKLWDTRDWRELATLRGHRSGVESLRFSPTGELLASGDVNGVVKLWSAEPPPAELDTLDFPTNVTRYLVSPDLSVLGGIGPEGSAVAWNLFSDPPVRQETSLGFRPRNVYTASRGQFRATDLGDGSVRLWDAAWRHLADLADPAAARARARAWVFSPDGKYLAVIGTLPVLQIWDPQTQRRLATHPRHPAEMMSVKFSPDGSWLAVGYRDGLAEVWSLQDLTLAASWPAHPLQVTAVAFSPDNRLVATAGAEGHVHLWTWPGRQRLASPTVSFVDVPSLAFSPDGRRLVAGTGDGLVKLLDLHTHHELLTLKGHRDPYIFGVGFTPDGRTLISASLREIRFWRAGPIE